MKKSVLILSTGLRQGGNSDCLAQAFAKGAEDAGHEAILIRLANKRLEGCRGCLACQKSGKCVLQDDVKDILPIMKNADAVAFATPIYFYGMCGSMKSLLDRTFPLYGSDVRFKNVYLLSTAGELLESTVQGAANGLLGWTRCFKGVQLAQVVFAGGVLERGAVQGHQALAQAYEVGKRV